MTIPLKPCPFCGGPASIRRVPGAPLYSSVGCAACGCHVRHVGEEAAAAAWSRRVPAPPIEELRGKIPVVLYFPTREDADEFIQIARSAFTKEVEIKLP
jgi:hypothetical protein